MMLVKLVAVPLLTLLIVSLCMTVPASAQSNETVDNWALLVVGSNSYFNYRHQADAAHAYKLLLSGGYPASNIIVMSYNDVPEAAENPIKDNLINSPNGPNLFPTFVVDYQGEDVTASNMLAVLSGNITGVVCKSVKTCAKRVIKSSKNDRIFVAFFDHGAPGLVAMPVGPYLYQPQLQQSLLDMQGNSTFSQLVFYMEACESGSMFETLPAGTKGIYALTAANDHQSSYATYFDAKRQTYLGDLFSVVWMENTDNSTHPDEATLQSQFETVKKLVTLSEVLQFGDLNIAQQPVADFFTYKNAKISRRPSYTPHYSQNDVVSVNSRDVKLETLKHQLSIASLSQNATLIADKAIAVRNELFERSVADTVFETIARSVVSRVSSSSFKALSSLTRRVLSLDHKDNKSPLDFECLEQSINAIERACGRLTDYSLKYVRVLVNICDVLPLHGLNGNFSVLVGDASKVVCPSN